MKTKIQITLILRKIGAWQFDAENFQLHVAFFLILEDFKKIHYKNATTY
jgi:hypothetical protein